MPESQCADLNDASAAIAELKEGILVGGQQQQAGPARVIDERDVCIQKPCTDQRKYETETTTRDRR